MPTFANRHFVPFTTRQMYELVADVERYPEFLPLCESLTVTSRQAEGSATRLIATMGVGYKSIRERFTSRVLLQPEDLAIDVAYQDGPFHHLENRWRFLEATGGSEIDFFISYEFRSRMLAVLMGGLFDQAFRRFTAAFEERARAVYGTKPAPAT